MDSSRRSRGSRSLRSSRWRSISSASASPSPSPRSPSPPRTDDEVDPHTVVPPSQQQQQQQQPPPARAQSESLQPPPPRYGAPSSDRGRGRRMGSVSSRRSYTPATPDATEESETEYFPPLGIASSAVSRTSSIRGRAPSYAGSTAGSVAGSNAGGRPVHERIRQPSVRIRRRSSSGGGTSVIDYASESSDTDAGRRHLPRPRSISQPMPAAQIYPDANVARLSRRVPQVALPRLTEEGSRPTMSELGIPPSPLSPSRSLPEETLEEDDPRNPDSGGSPARRLTRKRKLSKMFWPGGSLNRGPMSPPPRGASSERGTSAGPSNQSHFGLSLGQRQGQQAPASDEYGEDLVDWLDIIDPEVQTLSTLTNVQNSLFVPDLGPWINRRPTYVLSQRDTAPTGRRGRAATTATAGLDEEQLPEPIEELPRFETGVETPRSEGVPATLRRSDTITSRLTDSHYAALPHGISLEGWTEEEKAELDDRVRHMLHSKRSRFKRQMKGFGQYVRRPLGFFVTLYAVLITLFGLAWVLFLIGWIYVGDKQVYTIHIIDSVLVALFAVMGDGLAPFRAIDTYHMAFVIHYSRKIEKAKKKKLKEKEKAITDAAAEGSVELTHYASGDPLAAYPGAPIVEPQTNGLEPQSVSASASASVERIATSTSNLNLAMAPTPDPEQAIVDQNGDVEAAKLAIEYDEDSPLTFKQWKRMRHHQKKLAKSHSFYKPDETFTHFAFPLPYLIAIVILLDCHSCLQISLGATTWGIDYHHRPFAITTVILCVSIACNISAGLTIMIGDRKTRKKEVWKLLTRQELTGDAIKHLETKRAKEQSQSHDSGHNSVQEEQTDMNSKEDR
ncbi:hypothetical protein TGAM01_v204607 [Trichoderma gamsii]|uniref:Integral membrane protein n=1 Tax=Trichoderma gamsii TaxID=398673 RepID=A0A2P4ZQL4_9HYPO|nr:hypothetical protein TGAM01_v204607 [Trichoderma gamsii]PON26597.1 hypothetical protein TGAM01_v204607 [Trichoderma gamsii]